MQLAYCTAQKTARLRSNSIALREFLEHKQHRTNLNGKINRRVIIAILTETFSRGGCRTPKNKNKREMTKEKRKRKEKYSCSQLS